MTRDLLARCRASHSAGMTFPKVWATILRGHPAVMAEPKLMIDAGRPWVEVPLATGEHLAYEEPIGFWIVSELDLLRRARVGKGLDPEQATARRLRHKAEELRTFAASMSSDAKRTILGLADTYDRIADGIEGAER